MDIPLIYPCGQSESTAYAVKQLAKMGYLISDCITPKVTHLLADIPSYAPPSEIIPSLPENTVIIGGKLDSCIWGNRPLIDLLTDEAFLCCNAAITAQCAIRIGYEAMNSTYDGIHCMVIGWGRIGKHLTCLLSELGAKVTVAARNEKDIALLRSFKTNAVTIQKVSECAVYQGIIFNTIPAPVLQMSPKQANYIAVDLASSDGISGSNVIRARGLPSKMSPELTGSLIAKRIAAILSEESI